MKTPVAIVAANRLNYFKRVVDSLVSQVDDREVFAFIDYCGSKRKQDLHAEYLKTKIPHSRVVCRSVNFGCGRNMIDARRTMFDKHKFEQAFICEDDGVLSPYYLSLCENLLQWCSSYSNVEVVQGYSHNFLTEAEKEFFRFHVEKTYDHLWGYLMTKDCWEEISDTLYEYENKFLMGLNSYKLRNHRAIFEWLKTFNLDQVPSFANSFPPHPEKTIHTIMRGTNSGQDIVTALSLERAKIARVATTVSRLTYIGEYGVHFSPSLFKKNGFDKIEGCVLSEDKENTVFKVKTIQPTTDHQ